MGTNRAMLLAFMIAAFCAGCDDKDTSSDDNPFDPNEFCEDVSAEAKAFDPNVVGTRSEPTWIDPSTGLMWETDLSIHGGHTWQANRDHCDALALGGFDDWRMPTLSEYRSLIRCCPDTQTGGACPATDECTETVDCLNDACGDCGHDIAPPNGCYWPAELSGNCLHFISSTFKGYSSSFAWTVDFDKGSVNTAYIVDEQSWIVRCVRGEWSEK